jgi:hypothetical protein
MSDASDLSAPKDPAAYRAKPLLGATFWAMIAFGVLCVLAGVGVATYLPRLWAPKPPATAAEPAVAPSEPAGAPSPAAASATSPAPPAASGPDVARLSARVGILEARQSHLAQAAAAALAAATVAEASQGSGPFGEEVASLSAAAPASPELMALARLAQTGAPSRTALAASFPEFAARAASAGHAPGDKASLADRVVYVLSKVVSLRRVGEVSGNSADALLARAERAVGDGDLDHAFRLLDRLPQAAKSELAPWRERAERRAEIDRDAQALRARALQELAAETKGSAATGPGAQGPGE